MMAKKKRLSEKEKIMRDIPRDPILFKNYDYTDEEPNETSPGGGLYHGPMDKYKSVKEFIDKRRRQRKCKNKRKKALRVDLLKRIAAGKRILVIDNDKYRHDIFIKLLMDADITSAYGFDDSIRIVAMQPPFDEIYFDHDLNDIGPNPSGWGEKDRNGEDIARYLVKNYPDKRPQLVRIHSWNPIGARHIYSALKGWGVKRDIMPFGDGPGEDEELNKIIEAGGLKSYASKKRILIIDDDKERHDGFDSVLGDTAELTHVYTFDQAIKALNGPAFDEIYFDHDLGDYGPSPSGYGETERTGADIAAYLVRMVPPDKHPSRAVIHSWNPVGAQNIAAVLKAADIPVVREPYGEPYGEEDMVLWVKDPMTGKYEVRAEIDQDKASLPEQYELMGYKVKVLPFGEDPNEE
jgi:CheY-like chemotaxis protein